MSVDPQTAPESTQRVLIFASSLIALPRMSISPSPDIDQVSIPRLADQSATV